MRACEVCGLPIDNRAATAMTCSSRCKQRAFKAKRRAQQQPWPEVPAWATLAPRWHEHAACAGIDPELWFPPPTRARDPYAVPRRICLGCPVVNECLDDALRSEAGLSVQYVTGMRGGLTPQQRARVLRERAS